MSTIDEFGFLERYPVNELVLGPIQRSEAIAIYGLLRTIRPRRVIEIGFGEGDSTEALLAGIRGFPGATVTSYDIRVSWAHASSLKKKYSNLEVIQADQTTLQLGPDQVDFLFLDASHDFDLNKIFWNNNVDILGPGAYVVIHDTGMWADGYFNDASLAGFGKRGTLRGIEGRFHQPGEVEFVDWVTSTESRSPWTRVDIGSRNCFRHGFTVLQRKISPLNLK